jgi:hypothetical protein
MLSKTKDFQRWYVGVLFLGCVFVQLIFSTDSNNSPWPLFVEQVQAPQKADQNRDSY